PGRVSLTRWRNSSLSCAGWAWRTKRKSWSVPFTACRRSKEARLSRNRRPPISKTMLRGKAAIVTGSTSGIGLGIARALAEAGCKIMLNGFADPLAIEQERKRIVRDFGVETHFDSADLSK